MWCCPRATFTFLARAQRGLWSVHVPVPRTLPCPRAPSAAQVNSRARQDELELLNLRLPGPQVVAAKAEIAQLQTPCSLPENYISYQLSMGERLSSTARALGRPSVKSSATKTVAGADGSKMLVIHELPVTVHVRRARPTALLSERTRMRRFSPPETLGLRRCRVARSLCTRCFGRHFAASSSSSFFSVMTQWRSGVTVVIHELENQEIPPPLTISSFRGRPHVEWSASG